jgi:hypothetical protein
VVWATPSGTCCVIDRRHLRRCGGGAGHHSDRDLGRCLGTPRDRAAANELLQLTAVLLGGRFRDRREYPWYRRPAQYGGIEGELGGLEYELRLMPRNAEWCAGAAMLQIRSLEGRSLAGGGPGLRVFTPRTGMALAGSGRRRDAGRAMSARPSPPQSPVKCHRAFLGRPIPCRPTAPHPLLPGLARRFQRNSHNPLRRVVESTSSTAIRAYETHTMRGGWCPVHAQQLQARVVCVICACSRGWR